MPDLTSGALTHAVPMITITPLAQSTPATDVATVVDAHHPNLTAYLNQPVQDILARLGLATIPGGGLAAHPPGPPLNASGPVPAPRAPGQSSPIDPMQLIQPVTDALGTLGSGQFGQSDPTQALQGITQTLESAGQSVQQTRSSPAGQWQGAAATTAQTHTQDALNEGAEASRQTASLADDLTTAARVSSKPRPAWSGG